LLTLLCVACGNKPPDSPEDYVKRIAAARAQKDADFAKSNDPIPDNKKAEFLPLAYFPIDPEYNVLAALKPATDDTTFMMPTSSGQPRRSRWVGTLEFTLKGQQMTLKPVVEVGQPLDRITVMFTDLTTGTETYPSGRYIDLERTATGIYALDFNLAYNPYCYYNLSYECPLAPPENRLKIPVHAGEKLKK
jgi:uncharacterized protein (DUF1684 family)